MGRLSEDVWKVSQDQFSEAARYQRPSLIFHLSPHDNFSLLLEWCYQPVK